MASTTHISGVAVSRPRAEDISASIGYMHNTQSHLRIGYGLAIIVGGSAGESELRAEAEALIKLASEARRLSVWCADRAEALSREHTSSIDPDSPTYEDNLNADVVPPSSDEARAAEFYRTEERAAMS